MSRFLGAIAAVTLAGAAMMPVQASAAEPQAGISASKAVTSTDISAQRRYYRHRYGYYPRRYYGPRYRYGYYGPRYGYYGGGYPYGYYRPAPFIGFGVGPFGFRVF
jgi:hypothetical protein